MGVKDNNLLKVEAVDYVAEVLEREHLFAAFRAVHPCVWNIWHCKDFVSSGANIIKMLDKEHQCDQLLVVFIIPLEAHTVVDRKSANVKQLCLVGKVPDINGLHIN